MILPSLDKSNNKILVVDDAPQNILFLQEVLSPLGQVYFSESAEDALVLLTKVLPDIILLDIEMPEMNGRTFCQQLKKTARYAAIPIIFITAHQDKKFEQLALESGGVDFITKPFNAYVCKLRVEHQLQIVNQTKLLTQTQEELQQLVKQVPVYISYWDTNWHNTYSNDYEGKWFNLQGSSFGLHINEVFPVQLCQEISKQNILQQQALEQTLIQQENTAFTVHLKGQAERYYQVFLSPIIKDKVVNGYLITLVDVSDEKFAKRTLNAEKERLRVTLNSIGDAVIATDTEGFITFMNPIAERLTGWRFRDALSTKIETVMDLRDTKSGQQLINPLYVALKKQATVSMAIDTELVSKTTQRYAVEDSAAPIRNENGNIIGAIMVFHDISEATAMAIKMSHLANHDQLTDLPNRILLLDRLSVACAISESYRSKTAVLMVDIDNFKYLNDTLGHHHGDELICLMAERLKALIPKAYTLSRLGGDEFIIAMTDVYEVNACSQLAIKLINAMEESFYLAEQNYKVSISIGISVFPDDAKDAERLMRHADVAMYKAKQEGRNRYSFFSEELESALLKRHCVEKLLREKIDKDDLLVYYQPKFELKTRKIIGAEALVRLQNDEGAIVSPALFLPTAEETGLVVPLGYQVLFKACRQAKEWLDRGKNIPISVNVAAAQFADPKLQTMVEKALKESRLPVTMLELEVTETALMVDITIVQQKLENLKDLGIKISIDDFGTGYSSLAYLKKFNVDVMKIDMSFVRDMMNNKQDYEIVKAIISLGNSMGLSLIAEGVEDEAQLNALIALGCQYGQGYLVSKPVPAKDFKFN